MGWFSDDEEEVTAAPTTPVAPVNFGDDAAYQAELRKRLIDRMNAEERGMQADQVLGKEARSSESDLRRRLGLMDVLNRSAAQAGSIGGKIADTSAITDNTARAIEGQQQDVNWMDKDRASREQLNKYLMGKLLDQEGRVSSAKLQRGKLEQEAEEAANRNKLERDKLAQEAAIEKAKLAAASSKTKKEGTQVPGSVAAELGQFDSAVAMADDAMKSYMEKASSPGSSVKSWLPGSDANQYEKERNVTAQAIGTILEGGKLTEQDYDRYKAMLPSPSDTNQIAQTKVTAIKNLIEQRRKGKIQGLAQTGFDVSGVQQREPTGFAKAGAGGGIMPEAVASTPKITPQDAQALRWAQEHQDDPRAKAIFDRLKGKGM
jgi:hypothetical protein